LNKDKTTHENTFDALMDAAVDAIVLIDRNGVIERFSTAAEAMFGYEEDEVLGKNVKMLMPQPHRGRHDDYIRTYRETGRAGIIGHGREETALRKNGETFPILLTVGVFRQPGGRKFVGFIRDLSEARAAEARVRQLEGRLANSDRLVALGELTAGIAHEINQPLTAISAYADAARAMMERDQKPSVDEMHFICQRIAEQSLRAAEVVRRMRNLARSGSLVKGRHDVNEIVRNVLLLFEHEVKNTNFTLEYEAAPDLPRPYVDDVQIQQVLVNLVRNSLDALTEAGRSEGRIDISARKEDSCLKISVSDNGPGISEENRERLFDAFFTTRPQGIGLGLSICRRIATAHGGGLRHEPRAGGGSRFTLGLPLESIG